MENMFNPILPLLYSSFMKRSGAGAPGGIEGASPIKPSETIFERF